jgi:IclR family mhp operon transcriptional activator
MKPPEDSKSFIASIRTGLQALEAISRIGAVSTTELARTLRISRGKAHRVLRTLEHCGYVVNQGGAGGYLLTRRVAAFAASSLDPARLGAIASPLLTAWTRRHGWPLSMVVLQGDRLAVAATSDASSNLARTRSRTGAEFPVNFDGAGIALLSTLPATERAAVLRAGLAPAVQAEFSERIWARSFDSAAQAAPLIQRARTQGWFSFDYPFARQRALCVPMTTGSRTAGVLVLRFLKGAVPFTQALRTLLPEAKALRDEIERRLA